MTRSVAGPDGITASFLTEVLADQLDGATVASVSASGVGTGQVSDTWRLELRYTGPSPLPASMIAKVPAADQASRAAAAAFRTYEVEASFYQQLARSLPVRLAHCFYAGYDQDADDYLVLLEDHSAAVTGDQIAGLRPADAADAVSELAALHAAGYGRAELAALSWLNRSREDGARVLAATLARLYPGFRQRYASELEPGTMELIEAFLPRAESYLAATDEPRTLVHGDFRADNLLFGTGRPVVLDWQTVGYGAGLSDLSYFLASSLPVATRRRYEEALVRHYHAELSRHDIKLAWQDCWTGYRRYAFSGIVMDIIAAMGVRQTRRGDAMFTTMARRHARHALDLAALDLLPD
jgi:fructosamine-3-kinase